MLISAYQGDTMKHHFVDNFVGTLIPHCGTLKQPNIYSLLITYCNHYIFLQSGRSIIFMACFGTAYAIYIGNTNK